MEHNHLMTMPEEINSMTKKITNTNFDFQLLQHVAADNK